MSTVQGILLRCCRDHTQPHQAPPSLGEPASPETPPPLRVTSFSSSSPEPRPTSRRTALFRNLVENSDGKRWLMPRVWVVGEGAAQEDTAVRLQRVCTRALLLLSSCKFATFRLTRFALESCTSCFEKKFESRAQEFETRFRNAFVTPFPFIFSCRGVTKRNRIRCLCLP